MSPLKKKSMSVVDLWIHANKVTFSIRMFKLMEIVAKGRCSTRFFQNRDILTFRQWLRDGQQRFTEQQVFDLERELQRLTLLAELNAIGSVIQHLVLTQRKEYEMKEPAVQDVLDKCGQFTEDDETGVKPIFEELKNKFPRACLGINIEERKIHLSAPHLPGQWFKCHSDHMYFVAECGDTMERGRCPECKNAK